MKKLLAIYVCSLIIVLAIAVPLVFPGLAIKVYVDEGFSWFFIFISILTILTEPLTIGLSYVLLKIIKDIYNELSMGWD